DVGADGTLDSDTLNVGDGTDGAGTATLTNAGTVNADTVTVKSDGQLDTTGALTIADTLEVDGGVVNSTGNTTADTLNVDNDGKVNVNGGTTDVATTNINDGAVTVGDKGTLDSDILNVGDGTDGAGTATLTNAGTVNADTVTVKSDGQLDTTGALTITDTLTVDGGKVNVNDGTTIAETLTIDNSGEVNVGTKGNLDLGNDGIITLDEGSLNVDGKVNADNIRSDSLGNDKSAILNVNSGGDLKLNLDDGDVLFENLHTANGGEDTININGKLNINVDSGAVASLENSASISGTGSLDKTGSGEFKIENANSGFSGKTNVEKGTLHLANGGSLSTSDVTVKDNARLTVDKEGTELGGLTLSDNSTLSVVITPNEYTKITVNGDVKLNGTLDIDISGSKEDDFKNTIFNDVIKSTSSMSGNFNEVTDNSLLFNFRPNVVDKTLSLIPYVSSTTSLVDIIKKFGLDRALDVARALDSNFSVSPENDLSTLFYTIRDNKQAANAVLESLPTLAGASSQVVADTSKHLANLARVYERCEGNIQQGDKYIWARTFGSWET
ncbi:autotransporter outer membrane beta-barrel domain-containing protein, partial [Gallibacterium anatis]